MTDPQAVRAAEILEGASSVALACHASPDGDALGTMLALERVLALRGVATTVSFPTPLDVPPHYAFLPGVESIVPQTEYPSSPEVMVTIDCGSIDRLEDLRPSAESARVLVVIDHHASNTRYGHVNVVDPEAAASALLVYRMARDRGWDIDRDTAICLYTGIATDTGRFQFANTTGEVFRAAADLTEIGVPIDKVSRTLFEEHRFAFMRFLGRVLNRCELDSEREMVITWYDQSDLAYFGVSAAETESVIDYVRQAQEAEVAVLVKEPSPDSIKVSMRSLGRVDVSAICQKRGGGGHRMAAGYTSADSIPGTIADLKAAVGSAIAAAGPGARAPA